MAPRRVAFHPASGKMTPYQHDKAAKVAESSLQLWRRPALRRHTSGLISFLLCYSVHAAVVEESAPRPVVIEAGKALRDSDIDLFRQQGFLWIRGFASNAEVGALRTAMATLIDAWHASAEELALNASLSSLRSGDDASTSTGHDFLLESATRASFFLESKDVNGSAQSSSMPRRRAVRKVGHGLHLVHAPTREFVHSRKVAQLAKDLGWKQPVIAQTLHRLTPPLAAGVDRHQDSTTLYTEPPSCLGILLALEDASLANGMVRLSFRRLANASEAPDSAFWPVEVTSGDVVVTHGALEHFSIAGVDPERSRQSLQVHVVEATAEWSPLNWLQYPAGVPFEPLAATPISPLPARQLEL